ncbi:type 1 fimbriae anchoring protein FimD [Pseudomonas chlororaphis subsp. piscium]|uniref:Outer membrane usher protein fimD n=2 Tax=Pseudomonas chlororaphis TaxID=587753 RepID=A0AAX3FTB4_9PSED|nr:type 1 fimbriae anchoring protein FimD [Pseudomonas chlororaphis subsp. piscium]AZC44793.1 type 1 fimbriae anchoring protein FimD [Pseudomonas chlororaphis subsp. piscium]VEF72740.1 outer membrane usher protein fimD [Pseudomonas chlororaphis]
MRVVAPRLSLTTSSLTPTHLYASVITTLLATGAHAGEAVKFDSDFMQSLGATSASPELDLDAIANNSIAPGTYPVTIRLNQSFFDRRDMTLAKDRKSGDVRPCLSSALLKELGVKLEAFVKPGEPLPECVNLEALIKDASASFDAQRLTLDISVPQIALRRDAAGYVSPEEWDSGINAGILNYQFSTAQTRSSTQGNSSQTSLYANGGFNLGDWRFRSSSSFRQDSQGPSIWQRSNTYAQRDLTGIKGTLSLGESFTPGDMFDSVPFRGVQLASDMGMLPDSMQGYAPTIRGIAETQAKVEVRQNGYSLYTTYVAPGAFEINDLNAAGGSGDLEVVITEADGRERRFTQAYATLGNMLREKTWRYSLSAGQYNPADASDRPMFGEASLAYGLPCDLTLYGGLQGSNFYRAGVVGVGKSLGSLGAISLDVTQAQTDTPKDLTARNATQQGRSYTLRYGKTFDSGTSVRFAGYRYSTEGYRDFGEAVAQQQADAYTNISKRSRLEASINQTLGNIGSLYLNASQQDYWGTSQQQKQMQLGFNTQYKDVNLGVYASKTLVGSFGETNQMVLTLSMPLGRTSNTGTFSLTRNTDGSIDQRMGLSGNSGNLSYNIDGNRAQRSGSNTGSAQIGYLAPFAQLGAGVSVGQGYKQSSISASGSVLAHSDGLAFGQNLGETVALVNVKDTPNAGLLNAPGVLTDKKGYAVVPYLTPYRRNRIALDTSELDNSVDILDGVTNVVPRRGAVVKVSFAASRSEKVLLNVRLQDGTLLPFGTTVYNEKGVSAGVVGQAGRVLLSVGSGKTFSMKWGKGEKQHCEVQVDIDKTPSVEGYRVVDATCRVDR